MTTTPRNQPRKNPALPPERRWADVPGVKYPDPPPPPTARLTKEPAEGAPPADWLGITAVCTLLGTSAPNTARKILAAAGIEGRNYRSGNVLHAYYPAAAVQELAARRAAELAGPPPGYVSSDHALDLTGWARTTLHARAERHGIRSCLVKMATPTGPKTKTCYHAADLEAVAKLYSKGGKK